MNRCHVPLPGAAFIVYHNPAWIVNADTDRFETGAALPGNLGARARFAETARSTLTDFFADEKKLGDSDDT